MQQNQGLPHFFRTLPSLDDGVGGQCGCVKQKQNFVPDHHFFLVLFQQQRHGIEKGHQGCSCHTLIGDFIPAQMNVRGSGKQLHDMFNHGSRKIQHLCVFVFQTQCIIQFSPVGGYQRNRTLPATGYMAPQKRVGG